MALKAILDSLDDVPETLRGEYVEKGGKFELQVEGMKTQADIDRISSALIKERNDHKAVKERLSAYGDLDPVKVHEALDRIPELEAAAAGKLDDNKLNEIVETRMKSRTGPLQRQIEQLTRSLAEKDELIGSFQAQNRTRAIGDEVRKAGVGSKILDTALEDALVLAERVFEINEAGQVVTKDGVGVTPGIDAATWFTEMQSKRPHWWPANQGGGAGGSGNGGGMTKNPWSKDSWNLTEQGRIFRENPARAQQMATSAGTKVGGTRPIK